MNKLLFRTVFFCLSVLSLSSCRQDDETDRSNESGDLVAVNIPIEGVRVESADSPLTRAGSADTLTVTEDLEDGFVLETSLMPVSAGITRTSITTGLANDVQILAIAYKESGELYKYQYLTPGSPIIHLPKGERFKLVFYSYNSTTKPDISRDITGSVSPATNGAIFSKNASLNDKSESHKNNVMWGRIDLTPVITGGITLSGVTFTHLFSRLDWQLRSVVGTITECSGSVRNTYENGTIKLGNLVNAGGGTNGNDTWIGTGSANYAAPVKFDDVNSTDITSSKTVFCPNAGRNMLLALNRIVVGGRTFTGQLHTFPTKGERGVDYRAVSTIKRRLTVTFRAASGGTVTPDGAQTVTSFGEKVTSTAQAESGMVLDGWYDGETKLGPAAGIEIDKNMLTIIVNQKNENKTFEARFKTAIEWAPGVLGYNATQNKWYFTASLPAEPRNISFGWGQDRPWKGMNSDHNSPWLDSRDPCRQVTLEGKKWRMPTNRDVNAYYDYLRKKYEEALNMTGGGKYEEMRKINNMFYDMEKPNGVWTNYTELELPSAEPYYNLYVQPWGETKIPFEALFWVRDSWDRPHRFGYSKKQYQSNKPLPPPRFWDDKSVVLGGSYPLGNGTGGSNSYVSWRYAFIRCVRDYR